MGLLKHVLVSWLWGERCDIQVDKNFHLILLQGRCSIICLNRIDILLELSRYSKKGVLGSIHPRWVWLYVELWKSFVAFQFLLCLIANLVDVFIRPLQSAEKSKTWAAQSPLPTERMRRLMLSKGPLQLIEAYCFDEVSS